MRTVTVLGGAGAYPQPGQPCSGFLVDWDGFLVVMDLGHGTLACLLEQVPDVDIDAVVITHEHPDHCIDLQGLFRILTYGPPRPHRIPLYCPREVVTRLNGLEPDQDLHDAFQVHHLPGSYALGPFTLRSWELPHFVANMGIRLDARDGAIAYTGDTGPDPQLAELGRGVDLFIVDATDRPGETAQTERNLLTATEAGQWAARAGAHRVLLTHFWPGNDPEASVNAARDEFDGDVVAAVRGLRILL